MAGAFNDRLVQVTLNLPGGSQTFQDITIMARGNLFGSPMSNTCECRIFNLEKQTNDYIITQASPLKLSQQGLMPIPMTLDVGRQSYGTFRLFQGYVIAADVSQPPDISLTLRALANNLLTSIINGVQLGETSTLLQCAQGLAQRGGWVLDFQSSTPARMIQNYAFSGSVISEMKYLQNIGDINVFTSPDNTTLHVIDSNKALTGDAVLINSDTGMVGVPQVTDSGVNVRVMINNAIRLGGSVTIQSTLNPAANGTYKVVKMSYDLANREDPFWYILYCSNLAYYQGTT